MSKRIVVLLSISLIFSSIAYARFFGSSLCKQDGYHCLKVKRHQSWRSIWPDDHDRDIVMRVNRMNTQLYQGLTIAVPDAVVDANILDLSPFPARTEAPGEKLIIVDPQLEAWAAYDAEGNLVKWGPASAGSDWCRDIDSVCHTRSGTFRIFQMGSSSCYSTKFPLPDGGAPMPYCMYFNHGQALHGEPNGLPGYNASHGCVRLYVNDAEWLRYSFVEGPTQYNNYRGTKVEVRPYSEASIRKAEKLSEESEDDSDDDYDQNDGNY